MPRQPRKPREKTAPHEKGTTRLTRVRVLHVTDDQHLRFTHAGLTYWAPGYAFAGREPDLRTHTLFLHDHYAHHVVRTADGG